MEQVSVLQLRGAYRIQLADLSGKVLEERLVENTVVLTGRRFALNQLITANHVTSQNLTHVAVGSGLVAPNATDTALGNEVTRKSISSVDVTNTTATPPSWQAQAVVASNEGNTTLGEVGIFNSSSSGTMFARATFASFAKATSNILNISYTVSA